MLICAGSPSVAQTRPRAQVEAQLADFNQVYLGRALPPAELNQFTQEFVSYFGRTDCEAECVKVLGILDGWKQQIRSHPGQPEDVFARHFIISCNYFDPKLQDSLQLRLLTEPDPVVLVDWKTRRLMTRNDVIASLRLKRFLARPGVFDDAAPSWQEIDATIRRIGFAFGKGAHRRNLPLRFVFAAELWAGLKRDWPSLGAKDRAAVLAYIAQGAAKPLSLALYSRLMGVSADYAKRIRTAERQGPPRGTGNVNAAVSRYLKLQGDAAAVNAITSAGRVGP